MFPGAKRLQPQWLRKCSAAQSLVLPAWQAWVFAGSEWLGEALRAQACCRNDVVGERGSFALRAQDFARGLGS